MYMKYRTWRKSKPMFLGPGEGRDEEDMELVVTQEHQKYPCLTFAECFRFY